MNPADIKVLSSKTNKNFDNEKSSSLDSISTDGALVFNAYVCLKVLPVSNKNRPKSSPARKRFRNRDSIVFET